MKSGSKRPSADIRKQKLAIRLIPSRALRAIMTLECSEHEGMRQQRGGVWERHRSERDLGIMMMTARRTYLQYHPGSGGTKEKRKYRARKYFFPMSRMDIEE